MYVSPKYFEAAVYLFCMSNILPTIYSLTDCISPVLPLFRNAAQTYKNASGRLELNRGFLPAGFLAIDLAHYLKLPLFDPDSTITGRRLGTIQAGVVFYAVVARRAATRARSPKSAERIAWIRARHPKTFRGRSPRSPRLRDRAWLIDFRLFVAPV